MRGQSIVEVLVAISIVLLVLGVGAGVTLRAHPGGNGAASRDLAALLADARALAATTGDGATVVIGPNQCALPQSVGQRDATSTACLFAHRPISGSLAAPLRAIPLLADVEITGIGTPPYGIFISPSGFVAASQWSPSQGALSQEPVCATSLTIVFDGSRSGILDCTTATYAERDASPTTTATPSIAE